MINLEEELVIVKNPEKSICLYRECSNRAEYVRCYIHTYTLCPKFLEYWKGLTEEQQELIVHPENFMMF